MKVIHEKSNIETIWETNIVRSGHEIWNRENEIIRGQNCNQHVKQSVPILPVILNQIAVRKLQGVLPAITFGSETWTPKTDMRKSKKDIHGANIVSNN